MDICIAFLHIGPPMKSFVSFQQTVMISFQDWNIFVQVRFVAFHKCLFRNLNEFTIDVASQRPAAVPLACVHAPSSVTGTNHAWTSQKWLMLQRGWIKLFWGRCRDFSLKRLPKPLPHLITSSPSLMPTISTRCAFSYIAIWMRKPCDK